MTDPLITSPTLSASSLSFSSILSSTTSSPFSPFSPLSRAPSVLSLSSSSSSLNNSMRSNNNNNAARDVGRGGASSSSSSFFSMPNPPAGIHAGYYYYPPDDDDTDLPDPEMDPSTQLFLAQLTLADLAAYRATLKQKRPVTRPPDDAELAILQQEAELRRLVAHLNDLALARSIDKAVESDAELIRAFEVMEVSEREDRRAAQVLERDGMLPRLTDAQRVVGRKGFVVPEGNDDNSGDDDDKTVILGGSSFFSRSHASNSKAKLPTPSYRAPSVPKVECISCIEKFSKNQCITAPCTHIYCHACIISLVESCVRDESLYPVKCCKQPFPNSQLAGILTVKLRLTFEDKCREFGTPAEWRVYCCNPRCSAFLGSSSAGEIDDIFCGACRTSTCTGCKQRAHGDDSCQENTDAIKVREMARRENWQTCPGCKAIVELNVGCYHMTCRCRTEFCYLCAARWKNCRCPHWDEDRLVVDARRRVENEMGRDVRDAEPRVFENIVRARAEEIRTRHECIVHDWRNRNGGGACEHCGDYLPIFLKICRGCAMLVCRRCALNRL